MNMLKTIFLSSPNNLKIQSNLVKFYSLGTQFIDEKLLKEREHDLPEKDFANPFQKEKKQCILCKYKIEPDYKNTRLLSQFVSPYTGHIYGRHITGLCKTQQTKVYNAIRTSQKCGYMPVMHKKVEFLKDPKLFDPERPFRPHKY